MIVANQGPRACVMETSIPVSIMVIIVVAIFSEHVGVHSKHDFNTGTWHHHEARGSHHDDFRWSHFLCLSWWDAPVPRRNTAVARRETRRCVNRTACENYGNQSHQEKLTIFACHSDAQCSKRYAMGSYRRICKRNGRIRDQIRSIEYNLEHVSRDLQDALFKSPFYCRER